MTRRSLSAAALPRSAGYRRRPAASPLGRLFACLLAWSERHRERVALRALDDRSLADIGLDRSDLDREAAKPFWRR